MCLFCRYNDPYASGLINYWPIVNGLMSDIVGCAHMTPGNLTTLTSDRRGNLNAALSLNGGYTNVPPGVYFNSAFTITVWIYAQQLSYYTRVLDFGNGLNDCIIFSLSSQFTGKPCFVLMSGPNYLYECKSSTVITLNTWTFTVISFSGSAVSIYMNGVRTCLLNSNAMPSNLIRVNNYVGKSNSVLDGYSYSILDDLRIYNRSLSSAEINNLMTL